MMTHEKSVIKLKVEVILKIIALTKNDKVIKEIINTGTYWVYKLFKSEKRWPEGKRDIWKEVLVEKIPPLSHLQGLNPGERNRIAETIIKEDILKSYSAKREETEIEFLNFEIHIEKHEISELETRGT